MKLLLSFGLLFFAICGVLFTYSWYHLHQMLHMHAVSQQASFPDGTQPTTAYVTSRDGLHIAYWYFPVPNPKAVVILVHGYSNPGGKAQMLGHALYLRANGYSTALLDLRSFGESDGKNISLGVNEWQDVEAVYDHLKELPENESTPVGFLGVSMGAATAIVTNGKTGKGDFVIASVPYADIDSLIHFQIQKKGIRPELFQTFVKLAGFAELGLNYRHSLPRSVIGDVQVPILLISARQDQEVHPEDARLLYEQANEPKEYWQADSPHDVLYYQQEQFTAKVLEFLSRSTQK